LYTGNGEPLKVTRLRLKIKRQASQLPLALLVTRVLTDNPDHPIASDNLAITAHFLDGCANFHN